LAELYRSEEADTPPLEITPLLRWDPAGAVRERQPVHGLGHSPGLCFTVPAGEMRVLRIALGVYVSGVATTGLRATYAYAQHYSNLHDVLQTALGQFELFQQEADGLDSDLLSSGLSADQQFLVAHATRSYYGSTQLLDVGGEPMWVVNEGEYCMMNTLDLSVDQVFWELKQNPWVVRNLLDWFVRRYSYVDQIKAPRGGEANAGKFDLVAGGIAFTHDMGVHNNFSPAGHSAYELPHLDGCFSHMTAEELCNWVIMAATLSAKAAGELPAGLPARLGLVSLRSLKPSATTTLSLPDELPSTIAESQAARPWGLICWYWSL
jgi:hypothetical protein